LVHTSMIIYWHISIIIYCGGYRYCSRRFLSFPLYTRLASQPQTHTHRPPDIREFDCAARRRRQRKRHAHIIITIIYVHRRKHPFASCTRQQKQQNIIPTQNTTQYIQKKYIYIYLFTETWPTQYYIHRSYNIFIHTL